MRDIRTGRMNGATVREERALYALGRSVNYRRASAVIWCSSHSQQIGRRSARRQVR